MKLFRQNRKLIKELLLYGIIGGLCSTIDTIVFLFLRQLNMGVFIANFISVNVGIIGSFILNTFLNFKVYDYLLKRAITFFIIGYCGLGLSMLIMYLGIEVFDYKELVVKIFSIILVALFQFILNKLVTYRKGNSLDR
ncbi:GtrA family protein [Enterococcus rotai]|uniref:GtrA family protein n=1 Tax=Enterococcus rotai TaxID=118060 RepID=UPI0032B3A554